MARKILWGVLAVLILMIAGGYVLIKTKGDVLLQKFGAYVEETTGAPLVMDQLPSLKFFPNPGLDLGQASWGREDGDLNVRFRRASVRVAAGSLLAGKLDITGMEVDGLDVTLRLHPKTEAAAAPQPATAPPAPAGAEAFDPARLEAALTRILTVAPNALTVRDGRLTLQLPDGASAVFSHLDLTLKNVRPGGDTALNLTARVESRHPDLSGRLELAANATLADSGLNVTIRKAAFTPESGLPFTETVALTGAGVYGLRNGSLKLSSLSVQGPGLHASASGETPSVPALLRQLPGKAAAWVQFNAEGSPRALLTALGRAVPLADPATLTRAAVSGRVDTGEGLVRLTKLNGSLDATAFSGDVDLRPAPLALSGDLQVGDIALDPYLPARTDAPKPAAAAARPAPAATPENRTTRTKAWTLWPEMNLALRVNGVQARGVRVEDIQAKVEGKNGVYTVNPLTCRAFGSPITAALKADASVGGAAGPDAQVTANISAPQIDLDQLSKALFKQVPLAGTGTLNTTLSCNTAAPLPTLNGKGSLSAAPLTLAIDLLPPNAPAPAGTPRNSRFDKAMLTYEIHNGVATITDCTLTAPSLNAAGKGQVNLTAQTLDVSGTVQLPGLAVLPVRLTGPWSAPTYSLNARTAFDAVDQTLKQRGVDLGQEIQKGLGRLFRKK